MRIRNRRGRESALMLIKSTRRICHSMVVPLGSRCCSCNSYMWHCGNIETRCKLDKQVTCSLSLSLSLSLWLLYTTQKRNQQTAATAPSNARQFQPLTKDTCNTACCCREGMGWGWEKATLVALCSHLILAIVLCPYYDAYSALSWPNVVDSKLFLLFPLATSYSTHSK